MEPVAAVSSSGGKKLIDDIERFGCRIESGRCGWRLLSPRLSGYQRVVNPHQIRKNKDCQCFNDALVSSTAARVFLRIYDWRGSVPAAEAKKAEDASMDTLRIPRLPDHTGRLA